MPAKKFKTRAEPAGPGGAWRYLKVPFNVAEEWGTRGRVAAKGSINGFPFRTNIQPMDGNHLLTFNKQLQAGAQAKPGDMVSVTMERDFEPLAVAVPPELARAFRQNKQAKAVWDKLAYTHRKEFAQWISGGKQGETRDRRAAKAITMMLEKRNMSSPMKKG